MSEKIEWLDQLIEQLFAELVDQQLSHKLTRPLLVVWTSIFDNVLYCHRILKEIELGEVEPTFEGLKELEQQLEMAKGDLIKYFA